MKYAGAGKHLSPCRLTIVAVTVCTVLQTSAWPRQDAPSAHETASLGEALAEISAHCPTHYPETVTPLPEADALSKLDAPALMSMLENWNPALRTYAAAELAQRGEAVLPALRKATESEQSAVRAGATEALARIVQDQLQNWKTYYPDIQDSREAADKIKAKHAPLAALFIQLTGDPDRNVRVAAMKGLAVLRPGTPEAARAILRLCEDEDAYLADGAMSVLEKNFGVEELKPEETIKALKKAMQAPLPRGKGHIIKMIAGMDESMQRKFIPEMLHHLDWQPDRDTMFGASGQAEALQLLTRLRVEEVVEKIPALMTKTMRGPGLFEPCMASVKAFGGDAKGILPALRAYEQEWQAALPAAGRNRDPLAKKLQTLREMVAYVENL